MSNSRVILPILGEPNDSFIKNNSKPKLRVLAKGNDPRDYIYKYKNKITSLEEINDVASGIGSISLIPSIDGIIRKIPVLYNSDNSISLTLDEWRPIFYKKHHGDNQDTKRKAFERARKGLVIKGILDVSDDIYTFTPRSTGRVRDIIKTENDDYASEDRTDTDTPL